MGGLIFGSGVVVMHYIGMSAMRFQGKITWNYGYISASVIIAYIAATAAFWILFRLLTIYSTKEILRLSSSLLMALAVCGMHYTGSVAATFDFDPDGHEPSAGGDSWNISNHDALAMGAGLGLGLFVLIIAFSDLRFAVHRLSNELARADDLVLSLNLERHSAANQFVQRYIKRRGLCPLQKKENSLGSQCRIQSRAPIGGFAIEPNKNSRTEVDRNNDQQAKSKHKSKADEEHSVIIGQYRYKSTQQQAIQQLLNNDEEKDCSNNNSLFGSQKVIPIVTNLFSTDNKYNSNKSNSSSDGEIYNADMEGGSVVMIKSDSYSTAALSTVSSVTAHRKATTSQSNVTDNSTAAVANTSDKSSS
eukprot:CAMPEP_0117457476 /NCGR_PEP_ID=MMETSP0784-20121206/425_1 /TAXON_ID=39447 /ORGANISM="" /LENGTH=360 /DNA_ID=CAMNT_0005250945 /DNA_START=420 /DNA_END=1499 /DNA_ORIENTATION=+